MKIRLPSLALVLSIRLALGAWLLARSRELRHDPVAGVPARSTERRPLPERPPYPRAEAPAPDERAVPRAGRRACRRSGAPTRSSRSPVEAFTDYECPYCQPRRAERSSKSARDVRRRAAGRRRRAPAARSTRARAAPPRSPPSPPGRRGSSRRCTRASSLKKGRFAPEKRGSSSAPRRASGLDLARFDAGSERS